jgi:hypothetical protein
MTAYDDLDGGVTNSLLGGEATYIGSGTAAPKVIKIDPAKLSGTEGTILFWVRPRYAFHDSAVHTYLFATMNTTNQYEFVVADGWWPNSSATNWWDDGSNWLYFIHRDASGNAPHVRSTDINIPIERAHASAADNHWKFMAVTWKQGVSGEMNFYVNGRIPPNEGSMRRTGVTSLADFLTGMDGKKTLYLGNRSLADRGADAEFDELSIFDRALSADEIQQVYEDYLPTTWEEHRDRDWMAPELSASYAPPRDAEGTIIENRVLFDENALFLIRGVSDVIDTLKAANMNVYVPNIWHGRGARWKLVPSSAAAEDGYDTEVFCSFTGTPSCNAIDAAGAYASADPFEELIEEAHANGIEVHPWFTLFLHQWNVVSLPNKHIDSAHQGWTYAIPGGAAVAYDPESIGDDSYVEYIKAKIVDVVTRYDVDGINLDYVRYLYDLAPQSNATAIENRKTAVMAAIVDIVEAVRAVKPDLVISIDGHIANEFSHRLVKMNDVLGRNQSDWLKEENLIDVAFDMDYSAALSIPKFDYARESFIAPEKTPRSIVKLLGNYEDTSPVTARDSGKLVDLVTFSQNKWPGTVGIYWMDEFYRDPGQVTALAAGPFDEPARTLWKFDGPQISAKQVSTGTLLESHAAEFDAEAIHIEEGDLSGDIEWFLVQPSPAPALKIGSGATLSHLFEAGTHEVFARVEDSASRVTESKKMTVEVDPVAHGLTGEYYNGTSLGGSAVLTRVDSNVNHDWQRASPGSGVNADYFSVRWTGRLIVPAYTGNYEFCLIGDDGFRLWVNDTSLFGDDHWVPQDSVRDCATISLTGGQSVPIKVEFFDEEEEAILHLKWSYPGQAEQVVPTTSLYAE